VPLHDVMVGALCAMRATAFIGTFFFLRPQIHTATHSAIIFERLTD